MKTEPASDEHAASGETYPLVRVRVNESLSRGLADRAIEHLGRQGAKYRTGLLAILRQPTRSKKSIRRVRQEFIDLGERTKLIQVIGSTPNARQVTVCQFVPEVAAAPPGARGSHVRFVLHQFVVSRSGVYPGADLGTALTASEHAVERLFLRLNTLDLAAVVGELHDAMLLALPLWSIGHTLQLRQIALPTSSGTFLCDLDPERPHLDAKTWIPSITLGTRWSPVVASVRGAIEASGGPAALATALCVGIEQALEDESSTVFDELAEALAGFPWLREAYAPRPDAIGEAWRAHATRTAD